MWCRGGFRGGGSLGAHDPPRKLEKIYSEGGFTHGLHTEHETTVFEVETHEQSSRVLPFHLAHNIREPGRHQPSDGVCVRGQITSQSLAGSFPDLCWSCFQTTYKSGNRDPYLASFPDPG